MTRNNTSQVRDIRVVVLVGGRDFGRCPLAARLPAALWPIGDRPVLLRLLDHLAGEGVTCAAVCCAADTVADVESVCRESRLTVSIVTEELISGTGGCLRDAASSNPGDVILVLSGSTAAPPAVGDLVDAHQSGGADMTVVFNPPAAGETGPGPAAEIFLCRPQVIGHIPAGGYSDIKEGVIPAILRAGGTVRPLVLEQEVGNFHDHRGYLEAIDVLFRSGRPESLGCESAEASEGGPIYRGADAFSHPRARVCGPVVMGERARVLEGAVVVGPAVIGRDAVVGENSAMIRSALWAGAAVGTRCEIRESILGDGVAVPDGTQVVGQALPARPSDAADGRGRKLSVRTVVDRIEASVTAGLDPLLAQLAAWTRLPQKQAAMILGGVVVGMAFVWSYWSTLVELMRTWQRSDEYSSGLLVPPLAAYVIWLRRQDIGSVAPRAAVFWGIVAFALAQAVRVMGLYYMFQSAQRVSVVLTIVALVLLVLGWRYLARLTPILLFLCLMLPWPNRVQSALALPLQQWATGSAVFCLELAGWEVVREGNVIHIGDTSVAVAEACNGLRMITAFFVISALVVLLTRRPWWAKLIVLLSSLPIALLCNTLRLAVTAVFFTILEGQVWEQRFHDYGGYAMMPLALALVVGELWLLTQLTTPPVRIEPAIISRRQPHQVPDP